MTQSRIVSLLSAALALAFLAQCRTGQRYFFQGYVYDGVTRQRVTGYTVELVFGDQKLKGKVDTTGRFSVGELYENFDYVVNITANGYRPFSSVNAGFNTNVNAGIADPNKQTIYWNYDATMFPTSAQAPAATFHVILEDTDALPSGNIQFIPQATGGTIGQSVLAPSTGLVAIPNQNWANTLDASVAGLVKPFTNGQVDIAAGDLVYGVAYAVTIYGVPGYAINSAGATYVAGNASNTTFTLLRQDVSTPLLITHRNIDDGNVQPNGDLKITFNEPIELDPTLSKEEMRRALEPPNPPGGVVGVEGMFGIVNTSVAFVAPTPKVEDATAKVYGVDFNLDATGTVLTVTFGGLSAFTTVDATTKFCGVRYLTGANGLAAIRVRPKTVPNYNGAATPSFVAQSLTTVATATGVTAFTVNPVDVVFDASTQGRCGAGGGLISP